MKIAAISGSLRKGSYNSAIINHIRNYTVEGLAIETYVELENLPHYNADLDKHETDEDRVPVSVAKFRKKLSEADALIISTPEYAFQLPGTLKNALDWLVSSATLMDKPVGIISASTSLSGGEKAHTHLKDLINILSGKVIDNACLKVGQVNKKFDDAGELKDKQLNEALNALVMNIYRLAR